MEALLADIEKPTEKQTAKDKKKVGAKKGAADKKNAQKVEEEGASATEISLAVGSFVQEEFVGAEKAQNIEHESIVGSILV